MTLRTTAYRWGRTAAADPVTGPIALGLGVRLLLLVTGSGWSTARFAFADSDLYLRLAAVMPGALWSPPPALTTSTLARTPAYPLLIRAVGGDRNVLAIVVVQCVLGAVVNVWLAHRLARSLFGPSAALVAALVVALDPASIAHQLLVATETLASTLLLLAVYGAHRVRQNLAADLPVRWPAATTGLALGLLTLTRPNLLLLTPAAVAFVALVARSRVGLRTAALIAAVALAPVVGWMVRNNHVAHSPVLSTVVGQNLTDLGLAAAASERGQLPGGSLDQGAFDAAIAIEADRAHLSPPVAGDTFSVATNQMWTDEGAALVRDHPVGTITVMAQSLVRTAAAPSTSTFEHHVPQRWWGTLRLPVHLLGVVWLIGFWALATTGGVHLVRRRQWGTLALLAGTAAVVVAASVGPWMYVRFRVPYVPELAVLAGCGWVQLRGRLRRRTVD